MLNNYFKISVIHKHLYNISLLHFRSFSVSIGRQYLLYDKLLSKRRLEAQRSVLIEVQSDKSCTDVYTYCCKFGQINHMFHYTINETARHFILIEFEHIENVQAVMVASTHINYDQMIPVQSTMLWFRSDYNKCINNSTYDISLPLFKNSCKLMSNNEIFKILHPAKSISEQIKLFYDATKLNDAGIRLRFFTAHEIERYFLGLFPNIAVLPFGSSVNGFGRQDCDLDLSLILENSKLDNAKSRLVFQSKSTSTNDKHQLKRLLETIADSINVFIPGISNIRKILEARIPIIKFNQMFTGVECDLTLSNMSAYYMSELLFMFGEIDSRVRPLIFTIRKWAQNIKLTNKNSPGPWITNFSISLMVIFFLQQKKLLPALNTLKLNARKSDMRITDEGIDCSFSRDISKFTQKKNISSESLEKLLLDFFSYFGNFDFETKAISIREGKSVLKPEFTALYISNPLETSLNVSKNVNFEELERIRSAMRNASWQLEAFSFSSKAEDWGLISLFSSKTFYKPKNGKNNKNNINFHALFQNNSNLNNDTRMSSNKKKIYKKS